VYQAQESSLLRQGSRQIKRQLCARATRYLNNQFNPAEPEIGRANHRTVIRICALAYDDRQLTWAITIAGQANPSNNGLSVGST